MPSWPPAAGNDRRVPHRLKAETSREPELTSRREEVMTAASQPRRRPCLLQALPWLNEQASSYVAPGGDPAASRVFDHPGLRVFAASPEHLLAMKAFAARPRDTEDIRQLVSVLDLHTADDVLASVREIFPEEEPPERLRLLLEDIFTDKG
jgi:hypothetical protein